MARDGGQPRPEGLLSMNGTWLSVLLSESESDWKAEVVGSSKIR